jgi:DUF4097 and DUF4098 domain-containing protein YvlB
MDELNRAIREAEKFLLQAKTEEIREVLRRKYFELLKRKYEEPKVSVESREPRETRDVEENLPVPTMPKVVKDMTKLHALKKFTANCKNIVRFDKKRPFFSLLFFFHKQNKNNYSIVSNVFY